MVDENASYRIYDSEIGVGVLSSSKVQLYMYEQAKKLFRNAWYDPF